MPEHYRLQLDRIEKQFRQLLRSPDFFIQQSDSATTETTKNGAFDGFIRLSIVEYTNTENDHQTQGKVKMSILKQKPSLSIESNAFNDAGIENNISDFFTTLTTFKHCQLLIDRLQSHQLRPKDLVEFHTHHKYLIMAYSPKSYKLLGRLISNLKALPIDEMTYQYIEQFKQTMSENSSPKGHANALSHIKGYLTRYISKAENDKLVTAIEEYRTGHRSLNDTKTLLRSRIHRHLPSDAYIRKQVYLRPFQNVSCAPKLQKHDINPQ